MSAFQESRLDTMRFKVMAEICPVSAWMTDSAGMLIYTNRAYSQLTGFELEDLQDPASPGLGIHASDRTRIMESWGKYVNDLGNLTYLWKETAKIARKDGFPIRALITCLRVQGDGFVGFTVPSTLSPSLLAYDNPCDNFFELSPDLCVIVDDQGYFIKVNAAWEKLGYEKADLLSTPFMEFVHPDDHAKTQAAYLSTRDTTLLRFRNRFFDRAANDWRLISWNSTTMKDGVIYAIGRDVNDLHELPR
jgi:PAS domain S-box-containing protein